jgi:ABC-type polysaccharide/polyol phosphate transport system ATPase subunit
VAFGADEGIVHVLKNVNLSFSAGEWIAVVGKNGSGKSTLGRVIAGLCETSWGSVALSPNVSVRIVFQNPDAHNLPEQ